MTLASSFKLTSNYLCLLDAFHPSELGRCPADGAEVKAGEEEEAGEGEKQQ